MQSPINDCYWTCKLIFYTGSARCVLADFQENLHWVVVHPFQQNFLNFFIQVKFSSCRGVWALLGLFSGGMLPDTPNPNLNTNQKMPFFHIRFQTRPLKSIPILRPGLQEIVSSLPRLECQQKDFLKPILNLLITLSFLLILLFRSEMTKPLIQSHSSLENHTRLGAVIIITFSPLNVNLMFSPDPPP